MILSAKKILNSKLSIRLRNLFGIRPIVINNLHLSNGYTISDSFLWRTDNQFVTTLNILILLIYFIILKIAKLKFYFLINLTIF